MKDKKLEIIERAKSAGISCINTSVNIGIIFSAKIVHLGQKKGDLLLSIVMVLSPKG